MNAKTDFFYRLVMLKLEQIELIIRDNFRTRPFLCILIVSIIFFVFPFIIYGGARYTGILPSAEEWYSQGTNHGPWRLEIPGYFVGCPLFLIMSFTIVYGIRRSWLQKSFLTFVLLILLLSVQFVLLKFQLDKLFWTID